MNQIVEIIQSPNFAKQKKKLTIKQLKELDNAIKDISKNTTIGKLKSGDLQNIRIYKYKIANEQILLAYEIVASTLYLYSFGSHQNFYRKLSKYIHN
jgi:mRNA-degrading endonuclease RelE of RelBE toxin-antitoxin system